MKNKTNLILIFLLLTILVPFVETKSEDDPQSEEFIEDYSMRGQTYRHWYKESSGEYKYSSDYLVHKPDIIDGTDWVTKSEYPSRFIIRLTDSSIRTFETPEDTNNYISLIDNSTIWAVGYESFAGVMGFYLNFADLDWGHGQYVYWPRLKNGQISNYNQPLYAIFPHLYVKTGGVWYDKILNDKSLYGANSDPRYTLEFFNNNDDFGIYFTTYGIKILSSNWDMVHGFKYNKRNTNYHMITQMRCNNRNFDDIGMAYEITSSPQSDGTPYQPEYFSLVNETDEITVNISSAWNAGTYLEDFYSVVIITSRNGESFRFNFNDMENAGFTEKYLNLHDQQMPDGRTRKVLRAGMYEYGSYLQGDWINIDPIISEDQTVDTRDHSTYRLNVVYTAYDARYYMSAGLYTSSRTYRAKIAWDTGITEEIGSTSDALFKISVFDAVNIEEGDYHAGGLYDKEDADKYWNEPEAMGSPQSCHDQSLYYEDPNFFTAYGKANEWITVTDDVFGLMIDAWAAHHNNAPITRQYLPFALREGAGMTTGVDRDYTDFAESTNYSCVPYIGFTYTIAEEEGTAEVVVEEEHDPIIQEPPVWFVIEFAWFLWTAMWVCAGLFTSAFVLYWFFKNLIDW